MKAIQQLISHFHENGRLTDAQIQKLVEKGYWGQCAATDLRTLESKVGQKFVFQVTGDTRGPLWGTDTYTTDSNLGSACVHAGVLRPGEDGAVRVTFVKPLAVFQGTSRHGMISSTWTTGWSGAFQVESVAK